MKFLVALLLSVFVLDSSAEKATIKLKFVSAIKNGKEISNEAWKSVTAIVTTEFKEGKVLYKVDFHAASSLKYIIEYDLYKSGGPKITTVSESPYGDASQDLIDAQDFIKHIFAEFDVITGKGNEGCFEGKSGDKVCFVKV